MSNLRSSLVRLAHSKPELRSHLLPLLKEAKNSDLDLREEIRSLEEKVGKYPLEAGLPSEDSLMDDPGKYTKKLREAKALLEKIVALQEKYQSLAF